MKTCWQIGAACWIRGARAFRRMDEGAKKEAKRDSSLRATPFGMTTFFKEGVDCSNKKPFATAQDKVQLRSSQGWTLILRQDMRSFISISSSFLYRASF